nr:capsular polysaccharide synthesis protein [Bifidobacterium eulemuris]
MEESRLKLENKTIHYCWFGGKELSKTALKSIASWEKYAPEYKIQRWDESNFNYEDCVFSKKAYQSQKWAFVSDYARFAILHQYGGIYLDVGSELIQPLAAVENDVPFSSFEFFSNTVNSGLVLAANPYDALIKETMDVYQKLDFVDSSNFLAVHTVNTIFTFVLSKHGLVPKNKKQKIGDWIIFDSQVFNPFFGFFGYHLKKDTIAIHHYSSSWCTAVEKKKSNIFKKITPFLGWKIANIVSSMIAELQVNGMTKGFQHIKEKVKGILRRERGNASENFWI